MLTKPTILIKIFFFASLFINLQLQGLCPINDIKKNATKNSFWNSQKRGANIFNYEIDEQTIIAVKNFGISFIRLAPDSFVTKSRDFLIGDADNYQGLVAQDVKKLRSILDLCQKHEMPVLLVFLSLPGSRWKQNNDSKDDLRLWENDNYLEQVACFWQDVAKEFKGHPAIVGYDLLNEPHPERCTDLSSYNVAKNGNKKTQEVLYNFNVRLVKAIREVDQENPIIIESSGYASPEALEKMIPIRGIFENNFGDIFGGNFEDNNILYSIHTYEPENYTFCRSGENFDYPGKIVDPDTGENRYWDANMVEQYLNYIVRWQEKYNIPSSRILVGEFGAFRNLNGVANYFKDLISVFNKNGWHWAVYSFREDKWDKMNYELGGAVSQSSYWRAQELGKVSELYDSENPIFMVLRKAWQENLLCD